MGANGQFPDSPTLICMFQIRVRNPFIHHGSSRSYFGMAILRSTRNPNFRKLYEAFTDNVSLIQTSLPVVDRHRAYPGRHGGRDHISPDLTR